MQTMRQDGAEVRLPDFPLLEEKLKEYKRRLFEAEWEDNWQEIKFYEREVNDIRFRMRLGEKYDMPF